jgi:hypothetical protein
MIVAYPRKTGAFAGAVQRGDSSLGAAGGGGGWGGWFARAREQTS